MDMRPEQTEITIVDSERREPVIYGEVLDLYANR